MLCLQLEDPSITERANEMEFAAIPEPNISKHKRNRQLRIKHDIFIQLNFMHIIQMPSSNVFCHFTPDMALSFKYFNFLTELSSSLFVEAGEYQIVQNTTVFT